ncbi:isoprenylcysteine carboxylmethyltransferase family protein [Candidatus Poribacteria bacterium]|nr:isoprenylcysteine carboxylmethyltransferase family protein [Candidatus Poribacteria bacterium]
MSVEKHELDAEDFSAKRLAVRVGRVFFKARNYGGLPLFLVMLGVFSLEYENDAVTWPLGVALILAGESTRIWAMRHIGRSARTRKDKARRLVTTGPYAYTRNPLYIGNHLTLAGFCVLSELLWFLPVALGLAFIFYSCIVMYEEDLLRQRFGEEFSEYVSGIPRWVSFRHVLRTFDCSPWLEALRRERSTLYGLAVAVALFVLKEIVSHN